MNKKVFHTLEFDKIINMLTEHATSDPGRNMCRELVPSVILSDIEKTQQETADALTRLFKKGSTSFGGNKNLGVAIKSLDIGSTLSMEELLRIAGLLENVARIKNYGRSEREESQDEDSLSEYFDLLEPLTPLSTEIRRCILSEDEISDDASPTLRKLRRDKILVGERIHSQLNSMMNGSCKSYLQDCVITLRNNRYCLPVKAEYKGQVPGMVHDQSSSGSTLFIEPAAVVNMNNQIKEIELQEKKEIQVILANLSTEAAEHSTELICNMKLMTQLDFIFAKASLALELNATRPIFNRDRFINIRKARHPLLHAKTVVPIDVPLGKDYDLLVVTGPNTGGKTVSLKTVGLLSLMGQSGLHIPASDRSELGIFTEVFADIGDEQSIEQNLSTFSSHMTSIVQILKHADENSLCLFDELNAGTDPTEGAALAISILNFLHNKGIRTMATTHYSELKVYALTTSFVENACCEFNVETLQPTYRLLIGIPGKSNAFAISHKLGLSDDIIQAAREQISEEKESFEDLLTSLEESRVTIEKEQLEIASFKSEIELLKRQLEEKQEKIDQSKDRILKEANEEAKQILQDAKDIADETIRTFQKAGPGASMKDLEKSRQKVRDKISEKSSKLSIQKPASSSGNIKAEQLRLGDSVKVLSMGLRGTVSSLPDHKGNLFVQCGIMRSQVNIKDLILLQEETISGPGVSGKVSSKSVNSGKIRMGKSYSISTEINLLGKTVDEAMAELDKYLDDAYLAHLPSVRIVHGKGTGALRNAVQKQLRRTSYVETFRLGEFGEGDAGVTIAEFKK